MEKKKYIKPFSIRMIDNDKTFHFHGFDRRLNYPNFYHGYVSLDTNFYWRTYKNAKNAINQAIRIKRYYDIRRKENYKIVVYDNSSKKIIVEI